MTEASVSNIVVREANANDFEWVADLMVRALTPFYDGDHHAHARRIFDTHIAGGHDQVGQFSSGQHMFIAESGDGQPAGVIHVVNKKQGTVKISPLIVDTAYRGKMGVGSVLLKHAEDFARSLGSRQIYCTVAAPNKKALGFFLKKGFRVTGTAKDHYKVGIDEHMLYKQLVDEAGFDSPNISVVPFDESQADSARALILSQMSDAFNGVDNDWVDALFAGYRRRELGDVNAKFKIIFTAECDGKVVGVAGATPKKGRPIKLMPLVASSEAAFEALVVDLQGLLEDYGHKLYVHLVPEPWQVACLQRHGWSLEGVFPGGYAPNSVVQQWGFNFNKEGASVRKMRIKKPYFDAIMEGRKTLEVRVGYNSIKRLKAGGLLQLETGHTSGVVRIRAIRIYDNFADMLAAEPWRQIVPQARDAEEALHLLRKIYPARKERLGVHVIEIERQQ
ncbi:MAG: GNAT family N-acetyltransferase [Candidatus Nanosynbacter sp.]|jgi:acetyltransferase, GNAT family|nr:GNAT family N-acetyltransferase [Candidatus Nanosynbacter sp.]